MNNFFKIVSRVLIFSSMGLLIGIAASDTGRERVINAVNAFVQPTTLLSGTERLTELKNTEKNTEPTLTVVDTLLGRKKVSRGLTERIFDNTGDTVTSDKSLTQFYNSGEKLPLVKNYQLMSALDTVDKESLNAMAVEEWKSRYYIPTHSKNSELFDIGPTTVTDEPQAQKNAMTVLADVADTETYTIKKIYRYKVLGTEAAPTYREYETTVSRKLNLVEIIDEGRYNNFKLKEWYTSSGDKTPEQIEADKAIRKALTGTDGIGAEVSGDAIAIETNINISNEEPVVLNNNAEHTEATPNVEGGEVVAELPDGELVTAPGDAGSESLTVTTEKSTETLAEGDASKVISVSFTKDENGDIILAGGTADTKTYEDYKDTQLVKRESNKPKKISIDTDETTLVLLYEYEPMVEQLNVIILSYTGAGMRASEQQVEFPSNGIWYNAEIPGYLIGAKYTTELVPAFVENWDGIKGATELKVNKDGSVELVPEARTVYLNVVSEDLLQRDVGNR